MASLNHILQKANLLRKFTHFIEDLRHDNCRQLICRQVRKRLFTTPVKKGKWCCKCTFPNDSSAELKEETVVTYLVHVFSEDSVGRGKVQLPDLLLRHHDVNPSRRRRRCRSNALTDWAHITHHKHPQSGQGRYNKCRGLSAYSKRSSKIEEHSHLALNP